MDVKFYLLILGLATCTLAVSGDYVPNALYTLDEEGRVNRVVYVRNKRDLERVIRMKRGGGYASSKSSASSSAGSGSGGSGAGAGGDAPIYFGNDYNDFAQGFEHLMQGLNNAFNQGGGYGGGKSGSHAFASSSSSSSSGYPSGSGGGYQGGSEGPNLFSRFGETQGSGIKVSSSAQGERGAFSSSSTSIDSNGKIKYSTQSGKY